ncbi:MAG: Dna2/Cas4 domain-containing protein [Methanolinea sp.]|jgi:CRISPR-associated exonuclease Cas4
MNGSAFRKGRTVPVSAVITAALCPMRLYLESRSAEPRQESPKYTICKQISSHLGSTLDPGLIWDEVVAIIPNADPDLHEFMNACISRCDEGGPWRGFTDTDVHLHSEKHGLSGNIDKIHDHEPFLSIVRSMHAPPAGVYTSDRLRVFGYMILMNETLGLDIQEGSVEYIPSGVVRSCTPGPIDKRRFLKAMRDARDILSGKEPPRPQGVKCQSCESLDACKPAGRRLSDLL